MWLYRACHKVPPKARRYCLNHGLFGNPQMFAGELDTSRHSKSQFTTKNPCARLVLRQKFPPTPAYFPVQILLLPQTLASIPCSKFLLNNRVIWNMENEVEW